jgi:hypothetical protein
VYPSDKKTELFWGRAAGDLDAGVVLHAGRTFKSLARENIREVPVLHPRELPEADIVKLDVEGAEAAILNSMDVERASLILLEYHNDGTHDSITNLLEDSFHIVYEDRFRKYEHNFGPDSEYSDEMRGNYNGLLFFANKRHNRLTLCRGRKYC